MDWTRFFLTPPSSRPARHDVKLSNQSCFCCWRRKTAGIICISLRSFLALVTPLFLRLGPHLYHTKQKIKKIKVTWALMCTPATSKAWFLSACFSLRLFVCLDFMEGTHRSKKEILSHHIMYHNCQNHPTYKVIRRRHCLDNAMIDKLKCTDSLHVVVVNHCCFLKILLRQFGMNRTLKQQWYEGRNSTAMVIWERMLGPYLGSCVYKHIT